MGFFRAITVGIFHAAIAAERRLSRITNVLSITSVNTTNSVISDSSKKVLK